MLTIDNITFRIAGREILSGASARLPAGRRVGLVGRNGAGKTTLLKLILGQLHADGGRDLQAAMAGASARWRRKCPPGPTSLLDTVLAADQERLTLLARARDRDRSARGWATSMRGWRPSTPIPRPRARPRRFSPGWAFRPPTSCRPCAEFSGGWRMRVALAAILFSAPDLLLLDEPTNYLDLEGVLWLENYLKRYRGSVLIVSHDRDLLNSVCEFILHLEHGKLTLYTGDYDTFCETRAHAARQRHGLRQEAGGRAQASAGFRRPLPRQGDQGAAGAEPHEDAGEAGERRRAAGRACRAHPLPKPESREPAAAVAGQCRRSATSRASRCCRASICASIPTTASRFWARTATANRRSPNLLAGKMQADGAARWCARAS